MKKLFILFFAAAFFIGAKAQNTNVVRRTITVNGHSEIEVTPDEIYVQVELREYTKKNGDKVDINSIKSDFLTACKNLGLADSDVVVQNYSGWDGNYWWYQQNKKKNPDMKAGITYWVKVSTTQNMDELVSKLDDQATHNFFIAKTDYSKMNDMAKQMKIEAIKNAKNKADYLANAAGAAVGDVITINEPVSQEENPQPRMMMYNNLAKVAGADETPAMNVDFKKIKIEFEASVVFELK
jgi:uncharacterized protein YggE